MTRRRSSARRVRSHRYQASNPEGSTVMFWVVLWGALLVFALVVWSLL